MSSPFVRSVTALSLLASCLVSGSVPSAVAAPTATNQVAAFPGREVLSFDQGWRFHLGDIPFPEIKGHNASYSNAKAGNALGAAAPAMDDTGWRVVNLPHDWAVEGPFDKDANLSQGYRPRGIAWYRKSFKLDPSDRGKHLELQIDGVSTHCTVWVNGTEVLHNNCGYNGFTIDLTPMARFGDDLNTVAIRVDANAMEGWWYEGAGMYRHTRLVKRPPVHLVTDGAFVQPVKEAGGTWKIPAEITVENTGKSNAPATLTLTLRDPEGKQVSSVTSSAEVPVLASKVIRPEIKVADPKLWSVDRPVLYTVETKVSSPGQADDQLATKVGFRTIRFDAEKGFFLNDQPVKIKGTCDHIDHAGVGVAVPDSIWDFRIRKLKEMGANAHRCAHNPPGAEFLDACDRLGLLVMDENRNFNCAPEYMDQLRWMVRHDRNHPSVILWSVFNEEPMQGTEQGYEMVRRMAAAVKELDTTRPVTAAQSGGLNAPINVSMAVDVVGFNYQRGHYDAFHKAHPEKPITSSEDASSFMSRDEYTSMRGSNNALAAYDDEHAGWGSSHREGWKSIDTKPFVAGGFVWTGFDYRGEPTPCTWPSASSFFGCMDLCGFPKTAFFLRQAMWIKDRPVLAIVPHWNWKGKEGKPIRVMVITNARQAELFLNGKSLGVKEVDPYAMVNWEVPYEPGTLEAVARTDGKEIARTKVETAGDPVALKLVPDRSALAGDGLDAMPVTVQAVDAKGHVVPGASPMVTFRIDGPLRLLGLGNGDPNCHEPEQGTSRSLFHGLGQAIVSSVSGGHGNAVLHASAPGLTEATVTIPVKPAQAPASLPPAPPVQIIPKWRVSSVTDTKPDPSAQLADNDMNSWTQVRPPRIEKATKPGWIAFRSDRFKPFEQQLKEGGVIRFHGLRGKGEIWVDGAKVLDKVDPKAEVVEVPMPAGDREHQVVLLFQVSNDSKEAGLADVVTIEPLPKRAP
jgi:beta-galactosidase